MAWKIKKLRFARSDAKLKTRKRGYLAVGTGPNACPTITLLDLVWGGANYFTVGTSYSVSIGTNGSQSATGGTAPYDLVLQSGSLPDGLTLFYHGILGKWTIVGTPTTFESQTFTLAGTDRDGCAITPKEYTIEVWAQFVYTGPTAINNGFNGYNIPVSGIPVTYGAGARLFSIELNITSNLTVQQLAIDLLDISANTWSLSGGLTGTDLTLTLFVNNVDETNPDIDTGSAPYTGSWSDEGVNINGGFDSIFSGDTIGDWELDITAAAGGGTLNSVTLNWKPI